MHDLEHGYLDAATWNQRGSESRHCGGQKRLYSEGLLLPGRYWLLRKCLSLYCGRHLYGGFLNLAVNAGIRLLVSPAVAWKGGCFCWGVMERRCIVSVFRQDERGVDIICLLAVRNPADIYLTDKQFQMSEFLHYLYQL